MGQSQGQYRDSDSSLSVKWHGAGQSVSRDVKLEDSFAFVFQQVKRCVWKLLRDFKLFVHASCGPSRFFYSVVLAPMTVPAPTTCCASAHDSDCSHHPAFRVFPHH
jgi:hypothetical protein